MNLFFPSTLPKKLVVDKSFEDTKLFISAPAHVSLLPSLCVCFEGNMLHMLRSKAGAVNTVPARKALIS